MPIETVTLVGEAFVDGNGFSVVEIEYLYAGRKFIQIEYVHQILTPEHEGTTLKSDMTEGVERDRKFVESDRKYMAQYGSDEQ